MNYLPHDPPAHGFRGFRVRIVLTWLMVLAAWPLSDVFRRPFVTLGMILFPLILRLGIRPAFPRPSDRENRIWLIGVVLFGIILFTFPAPIQNIALIIVSSPAIVWLIYREYRLFGFGSPPRNTDDAITPDANDRP